MGKKIKIGDCFHFAGDILVVNHFESDIPYCIWDGMPEMIQAADIPIPTLHLPISDDEKKWGIPPFSMILRGEKKEEYRHWNEFYETRLMFENEDLHMQEFKPWKVLHLTNGYGHDKPQLWAHIKSITIGRGKPEWGAPVDRDVFIIRLGDVFHTKNLKQ